MVSVPIAMVVAALTDARWLVFVLAAVSFGGILYALVILRCPECKQQVLKKSGDWPFESPKNPHDPLCAKCGLDLRTV